MSAAPTQTDTTDRQMWRQEKLHEQKNSKNSGTRNTIYPLTPATPKSNPPPPSSPKTTAAAPRNFGVYVLRLCGVRPRGAYSVSCKLRDNHRTARTNHRRRERSPLFPESSNNIYPTGRRHVVKDVHDVRRIFGRAPSQPMVGAPFRSFKQHIFFYLARAARETRR